MILQTAHPQTETGKQTPWSYFTLSPFSQVAIRVMKLVNKEDAPFAQISDLISSDPAFASEVLKAANCLWYTGCSPAVSILQAVARIGAKNLQGICLTVAIRSFIGNSMSRPVMRDIWRHNLACAFIAEELAPSSGLDDQLAFTGGILHDLGRLALAALRPKDYVFLLGSHTGTSSSILDIERETFGYDHCEVGEELVSGWKLPGGFDSIVAKHHSPRLRDDPWDMAALVNLSCRMADTMGFPAFHGVEIQPYADLLLELPVPPGLGQYPDAELLSSEVRFKIESVEAI